ncbi:MAG: hypothetical protein AB7S63_07985 [Thauera sp.]|jgi:hypothetical protein
MSCSERLRPAYCGLLRLALWLALCVPGAHAADALEIVIVSASAGNVATLERGIAEQLYLGQRSQLADGHQITVIDLPAGAIRDHFYRTLTGKKPSQIRAYWSRLVFTGRARPPREATSVENAIELIIANPDAIGYLPAEAAQHPGLKVLQQLD